MDTNIFTQRLREAREKEGLSLKELQARVGISLSALNNYVAGKTVPPLDVAVRLAKELHVSLDWLSGINGSDTASVIKVSNCYETACVLNQILELYQEASIEPRAEELWDASGPISRAERITLRLESSALYDYYVNRKRLEDFGKSLPIEMQEEYQTQRVILGQSFMDALRRSKRPTGIKEEYSERRT